MKIESLAKLICVMALFSGCKQAGPEKSTRPTMISDSIIGIVSPVEETIDPTQQDVQILLPTQYRKESGYPENVRQKEWFELYFDGKQKQWKAAAAKLQITHGWDECVGDSTLIIKSVNDPLLFFTKIENLQSAPKTILTEKELIPNKNSSFTYNNNACTLMPIGNFTDHDRNLVPKATIDSANELELQDYYIKDYRLSFSINNSAPVLLITEAEIQYNVPKLLWAGDLNGDGLPDLIIDAGDFYESQKINLFLSNDKDKNAPIEKAAEITVTNDC